MGLDINCECARRPCNDVTIRRGPVFVGEERHDGWLHIECWDGAGTSLPVMLSPRTAKDILWWMLSNYWRTLFIRDKKLEGPIG